MATVLNLSKEESLKVLDLRKKTVDDIVVGIPQLANITSRVALVLDFSGSMRSLYNDGTVQSIIERIMPIAMKFDDNGELDLWIFENGFHRLNGVTINNFYGLAQNIMSQYRMGGTQYAPVINDIYSKYVVEEPAQLPNYVIFITDGDNSDKAAATQAITKASGAPIFWQFIGIGNSSFDYLEQLDTMPGRYIDNANFFAIHNINAMEDKDLYSRLFAEYPSWLQDPKAIQLINNPTTPPQNPSGQKKGLFGKLFG